MKFDTNEFLRKTMSLGDFQEKRKRVICKDGFSISIQAGMYYYCEPRLNFVYEYKSVELGFPSEEDELINEYVE